MIYTEPRTWKDTASDIVSGLLMIIIMGIATIAVAVFQP